MILYLFVLVGIYRGISVSQRAAARSVQVDNILIKLFYFDSTTSLVPFKGVSTSLTPDANMISYREWWQLPSVKGPSFSSLYMLFLRTSSLLLSVVSDSFWSGNMGPPKRHMAGEGPVWGSGVLQYWRIASWRVTVSRLPLGTVFNVMSLLAVLTATSALQFECGKATEDRWLLTPQFCR